MDHSDLETWLSEHAGAVRAVLRGLLRSPEDVEDCYQSTVLIAWQRLEQVVPAARRAWLIQVAKHEAIRLHRRAASGRNLLKKFADVESDRLGVDRRGVERRDGPVADPAEQAEVKDDCERIQRELLNLPQAQREVIQLKLVEGLTFQEIADRLQVPLGTALTRMRLGLDKLSSKMKT